MMNSNKKYNVACYGIMLCDVLVKGVCDNIMDYVSDVAESVSVCMGGDALNEAITCSHLGLKTALAGNLGEDVFGNIVRNGLIQEGIYTEGIRLVPGCRTAVNIVLIGNEGKRSILTTKNNNVDSMELSDISLSVIKESEIVCIGSLFVNESMSEDLVQTIYRAAQETGAVTVADAAFADAKGKAVTDVFKCLKGLDYFIPSYEEGEIITGLKEPEEIAKELLRYVNKAVILKLGEEGCLVCSREEGMFRIPIFHVDTVDTTGAGDNFVAGFLWGLSRKLSLKECCYAASAVGAISTTRVGANGAVTSAKQVLDFLENNNEINKANSREE